MLGTPAPIKGTTTKQPNSQQPNSASCLRTSRGRFHSRKSRALTIGPSGSTAEQYKSGYSEGCHTYCYAFQMDWPPLPGPFSVMAHLTGHAGSRSVVHIEAALSQLHMRTHQVEEKNDELARFLPVHSRASAKDCAALNPCTTGRANGNARVVHTCKDRLGTSLDAALNLLCSVLHHACVPSFSGAVMRSSAFEGTAHRCPLVILLVIKQRSHIKDHLLGVYAECLWAPGR